MKECSHAPFQFLTIPAEAGQSVDVFAIVALVVVHVLVPGGVPCLAGIVGVPRVVPSENLEGVAGEDVAQLVAGQAIQRRDEHLRQHVAEPHPEGTADQPQRRGIDAPLRRRPEQEESDRQH